MNLERMFAIARAAAKLSNHKKFHLGAVITRKSKVISVGFNSYKTHTKSNEPFKTTHAELCAILKSNTDLSGCSIYVYRESKAGDLKMARPCKYCMELIKQAGIKKIYYTVEGGYKEEKV